MSNLYKENDGVYGVVAGSSIEQTIFQAIALSVGNVMIRFEFNGVTVNVRADSIPNLIYRDWLRALNGYIAKNIGPYPNLVLTNEEEQSDARIEAENERNRQERHAQYEMEARVKREATDTKLAEAPEMAFADENIWQEFKGKNQDFYDNGILVYAERWARLMQREMANGNKLEDVARATSDEADTEGITGFMYGCAVSILAACWKYGEQLRCWHNLNAQLGNEGEMANKSGGVLNPALLCLG